MFFGGEERLSNEIKNKECALNFQKISLFVQKFKFSAPSSLKCSCRGVVNRKIRLEHSVKKVFSSILENVIQNFFWGQASDPRSALTLLHAHLKFSLQLLPNVCS